MRLAFVRAPAVKIKREVINVSAGQMDRAERRQRLLINRGHMEQQKNEVLPGTLNLMVLKTLSTLGPLHGYGIARRIEQISGDRLQLNQGTIYPALLGLEQMGWISSKWGVSENNRRAKYYSITRAGKKQLAAEEDYWRRASEIMVRFLEQSGEKA
jgi:transcriptional regulator